jgi:maltose alpha-D-glucosyltransferase / alpha-amylase
MTALEVPTHEPIPVSAAMDDPAQWYRDAVIYEVHVRAFRDSNGDGVGDFRGLVEKLDYIADLGVTAIWLLPFYPSPLKDDGYDISSYNEIHPAYGSLADFRLFLREARRRGLRVITELVLNHTSDQHPWFQRARRSRPGSAARNFYVWSDTPDRYRGVRIIFKDFESSNWSWDPVAQQYFWHRFYSHQPDLNWDNPAVREAMHDVVDFWFEMGVDGMRLDAVPYLIEREGTSCENLPETYDALRELRAHIDARFQHRMLLAEANQWPEDAVAYIGDGDACHMAFHFPLMPRMFMALRQEDRFPIIDIMNQTPPIPEGAQWALFLRNHDELTLEMVTDEERDYMYRVYAEDPQARINLGIRHRLASLLGNNRRQIELMNGLLLSLPGTPVIYYGDEIGMGDNIYLGDRNGVRTPMQWSGDRNAGFSDANPQRLYLPVVIDPEYHPAAVNVEAQQANSHSMLWWMRRVVALRRRYRAFGRGSLEFLQPRNRKVIAYLRTLGEERILVVANLSRFAQYVELDLSAFKGATPVELFGGTEFPRIGDLPYLLTLSPHAFYWLALQPERVERFELASPQQVPTIQVAGGWSELLNSGRDRLAAIMPGYLSGRRWFGARGRRITSVEVADAISVPVPDAGSKDTAGSIAFLNVEYDEGDPERYVVALSAFDPGAKGETRTAEHPAAIARLQTSEGDRVLIDALQDGRFASSLLDAVARRRRLSGERGKVHGWRTTAFRRLAVDGPPTPHVLATEQSNTSIAFDDRFVLKVFRRPQDGVNPDLEVGAFLTERTRFEHVPPVAGALEYVSEGRPPVTVGILRGFVPNEGDAWTFTLDSLRDFLDAVVARSGELGPPPLAPAGPLDLVWEDPPPMAAPMGTFLEAVRLLGERTAELHLALASRPDDPGFAPEPYGAMDRRALYQSMRNLTGQVFRQLRASADRVPVAVQVLDLEHAVLERFHRILEGPMTAVRIRTHGDFHLGQVLWTGKDFSIIDFEGEPAVPLGQRRIKRSPLRDVAGMLRSFHYAAYSRLFSGEVGPDDPSVLEPWVLFWYRWVSAAYLAGYFLMAGPGEPRILPERFEESGLLLETFLLEKAVYEIGYELDHRPEWVKLPVQGLVQLLEASP